jgi:hypothetical protein
MRSELAGENACPTVTHKGLRMSGAGTFACEPIFSQLLREQVLFSRLGALRFYQDYWRGLSACYFVEEIFDAGIFRYVGDGVFNL